MQHYSQVSLVCRESRGEENQNEFRLKSKTFVQFFFLNCLFAVKLYLLQDHQESITKRLLPLLYLIRLYHLLFSEQTLHFSAPSRFSQSRDEIRADAS